MVSDWHPEDIKAAIRKDGESLASLGKKHGVSRQLLSQSLVYPHARCEAIIAAFLGVPACRIWPTRYEADGSRKKPQPRQNYRPRARFQTRAAA